MSNAEIKNVIITSARLTIAKGGLLSAWLMLDYGGSGQGFGGHALYLPKYFNNFNGQSNLAGHFIYRCLEVAGVDEWGNLPGKSIRVLGSFSGIDAIGHIIKDIWFDPKKEFQEMLNSPSESKP